MAIYSALPLLGRVPRERKFGYGLTATALLFGALIGIIRVLAVARAASITTIFTRSPIHVAFYLTDVMFIIGISFSFFVLTDERYVADLSESNLSLAHEVEERHKAERALHSEMAERKALELQLKELVVTDSLTGVLNRRGLLEAMKDEVQRAGRLNSPLTVMVLDLDYFKNVNDTYGHAVGDQALRAVAVTCRKNLRVMDKIGRLGGEEFAVLLPATAIGGGKLVAEKLRLAVEGADIQAGDVSLYMTVSIGVAAWEGTSASGELMLAQADRALSRRNRADGTAYAWRPRQPSWPLPLEPAAPFDPQAEPPQASRFPQLSSR
jgi:diguanylate cyclase (GGDEF)-like protein